CAFHVIWVSFAYAVALLLGEDWSVQPGVIVFAGLFLACGLVSAYVLHRLFARFMTVVKAQVAELQIAHE
ncbi:MAG: hypothetical protein AAFR13_07570, partial [Pseudomonadota bacterium]